MMKKMRSRLRSQRGESITEVLFAVMISAIALTMLALMINATTKMVIHSRSTMEDYVSQNNGIVEKGSAGVPGTATFYIVNPDTSTTPILLTDDSVVATPIRYYVNDSLGKVPVTSYKKGATS